MKRAAALCLLLTGCATLQPYAAVERTLDARSTTQAHTLADRFRLWVGFKTKF